MAGGDEAEAAEGGASAAATSNRTRSTAGAKVQRKKKKKTASYKQDMRPRIERILGQMEIMLLTGMDEVAGEAHEEEWCDVECPALVRMFVNKRGEFARWIMDATSWEEAVGVV